MLKFLQNPYIRQYITVILVNLCMVGAGLNMAWSSPVLVKLTNVNQTILETPLTQEQGSWMVSLGAFSSLFANFVAAFLADRIGRKYCIFVAAVPRIIGQIIIIFISKFWVLLLGRLLSAVGDGLLMVIIPMYSSEIASDKIRGSVSMAFQISCSLGIVTMLCIGPYLEYRILNSVVLGVVIATTIPVVFLPDSPCYLMSKDKNEESLKVLTFLRGSKHEAEEEIRAYNANRETENTNFLDIFKSITFIKSLILVVIFGIGTQLTGYNAVSAYLQTIFDSSHTNVSPEISSVIIGCIQLFSCFCTLAIIDKFGRKPILATSLVAMALGYVGLGLFFHLSSKQDFIEGFLNYLPLISLILIVFSYGAGIGSLMWPLMCELFDNRSRAVGMSIVLSFTIIALFMTQKFFAVLLTTLGPATTYWIFCLSSLLLCVFLLFCIPETKGKSFLEIQAVLKGKRANAEAEKSTNI